MSHLEELIDAPGPKRMLSIDGGGIRGLIALQFLEKIETLLRERFDQPHLVLAQYFDYIAGTSTGAIIATLLSLGYAVGDIRNFYQTGAHTMFDPNAFGRLARRTKGPAAVVLGLIGMLVYKAIYTSVPLERQIKQVLGDPLPDRSQPDDTKMTLLGSDKLRTLLMMVTRNASTDSPWPISNNPRAKYNRRTTPTGESRPSNLDMPLWRLVRASTAAPVFFPPEEIHIDGLEKPFVFVDGGITVYNNPAFQLFLMATLPAYEICWPTGDKNLLLISVGTGLCESANLNLGPGEMNLMYNVSATPAALIRAAIVEQDTLCRVFGKARVGCGLPEIDSEIGDLVGIDAPLANKLFSYARYNVELSETGLHALGLDDIDAKSIQQLDGVDNLDALERVGKAAADRYVSIDDFADFLDAGALRQNLSTPPLSSGSTHEAKGDFAA